MTFQRQNNVFDNAIIPVLITNTTAETIPPYSCVAIGETADLTPGVFVRAGSGFGAGDFLVPVRKPDATAIGGGSISQFLFTLDLPIPADKEGYATPSLPVWASVATSVTARATNLGPVAGSWLLGAVDGFYNAVDLRTIGALKYAYVQPAGGGGGNWGAIIKTPSGGITGRSGTTVYSGSCDVFSIAGTTLTDTGVNIDVYNLSTGPVAASVFGTAKREYATGLWVIDMEECPTGY